MASSPIDIVKVFYSTYSLMGADKADRYLSPDFQLSGFANQPMGKEAWLGFLRALKVAMPDFKIRLADARVAEDGIHITETGSGTHKGEMDLSLVGLPSLPASGLRVDFLASDWILRVVDNLIVSAELVSPPSLETGLPGLVRALSARPAPQEQSLRS